jgi:hypothetical protein
MGEMAASQSSKFPAVPFSITHPQQSFRLLELPPELAQIIEEQRSSATKRRKLWLKSSMGRRKNWNGEGEDDPKEGPLHLCTEDKSWAVRLVSTSNSVHVTRTEPLQMSDGDGDVQMGDLGTAFNDKASGIGISAISQVKSILELIEAHPTEQEVETKVRHMIPIHAYEETEGDRYSASNPPGRWSLQQVHNDIAAPEILITAALKKLFACGDKTPSWSFDGREIRYDAPCMVILSEHYLLASWTAMKSECKLMDVGLDKTDSSGLTTANLTKIMESLADASGSAHGFPINGIGAILRRAVTDPTASGSQEDDFFATVDRKLGISGMPQPKPESGLPLDGALLRQLTGQWLLSSLSTMPNSLSEIHLDDDASIPVADFLEAWKDLLPASWAKECEVGALISNLPGWQIAHSPKYDTECLRKVPERVATPPLAKPQAKKNKWHEKFGAQRSAACKK